MPLGCVRGGAGGGGRSFGGRLIGTAWGLITPRRSVGSFAKAYRKRQSELPFAIMVRRNPCVGIFRFLSKPLYYIGTRLKSSVNHKLFGLRILQGINPIPFRRNPFHAHIRFRIYSETRKNNSARKNGSL